MPRKERFNVLVSLETMYNLPCRATGQASDLEQEAEDEEQMIGVGQKGKAERAASLGMAS